MQEGAYVWNGISNGRYVWVKSCKIRSPYKDRFQDVIEEITNEYGTLCRCIAVYDLGTNTPDDTEKTVSQIRLIFRAAAGVLAEEQPEYYEISCDRALTILKAVAALRGDSEEAIHEIKCGGKIP